MAVTNGAAPGWYQLIERALGRCVEERLFDESEEAIWRAALEGSWKGDALITVASLIEWRLRKAKPERFGRWLEDELGSLQPVNPVLALAIGDLEAPILTTNYDNLLEDALGREGCHWQDGDKLAAVVRRKSRDIGHLHGRYRDPDSVILGFMGYRAVLEDSAVQAVQQAVALAESFLFVGCSAAGVSDPNLGVLLQWYASTFPNQGSDQHFLLARSGDVEATRDQIREAGALLQVIGFGEEHSDLPEFVRSLARHAPSRLARQLGVYREEIARNIGPDSEQIAELLESGRAESAEALLVPALAEVEAKLADDPEAPEFTAKAARIQANLVRALTMQQRREEAREQLARIDIGLLDDKTTAGLAELQLLLGNASHAEETLAAVSGEAVGRVRRVIELRKDPALGPEDSDPRLRAIAVEELMSRDRVDEAGQIALELMERSTHREEPAAMRTLLVAAVGRWLLESATAPDETFDGVPVGDRERVLGVVEREVESLLAVELEGPTRRLRDWIHASLVAACGFDSDRRTAGQRALAETPGESQSEREPKAWSRQLENALAAGDPLRALQLLSDENPQNAPIAEHAAWHLLAAEDYKRAQRYARRAFELLPGRRQRLHLSQCLLAAGELAEAEALASELMESDALEALHLTAHLASRAGRSEEAALRFSRYLQKAADDVHARVGHAFELERTGQHTEASNEAWKALQDDAGRRLRVSELLTIRRLLTGAGALDEQARHRLETLAKTLHERYPGVGAAEQLRLSILIQLGFPAEHPPGNMELLESEGLVYRSTSLDELRELIRADRQQGEALWTAYQRGWVSIETLYELRRGITPFALLLESEKREGPDLLTPLRLDAAATDLQDRTVLVGSLELAVLTRLDLLDALSECADGLVLFEDVRDRLDAWAAELPLDVRPGEADRLRRTWDLLGHTRVELHSSRPAESDLDLAAREGIAVLHHERPPGEGNPWISPADVPTLLGWDAATADRWRAFAGPADDDARTSLAALPARFAVTWIPLHHRLAWLDLLERFLDDLPPGTRLVIGPETASKLRAELHQAAARRDAALLAVDTRDALRALERRGIVRWVGRPEVPAELLPAPPHSDWFAQAWSWREAQRELGADCVLLTADFAVGNFGAGGAPLELVAQMKWSVEAYEAARARYETVSTRQAHVPDVVRALTTTGAISETAQARILDKLAAMGFVDALDSTRVLALAQRFGGDLSHQSADQVLQGAERLLRQPGHAGHLAALPWLTSAYSDALWRAFCVDTASWPPAQAAKLCQTLLQRCAELDGHVSGTLEGMLLLLGAHSSANPAAAIVEETDSARREVTLGPGSPLARLWSTVAAWARGTSAHLRVVERALWAVLVEVYRGGPHEGSVAALDVSIDALNIRFPGQLDPHRVAWFARFALGARKPGKGLTASFLEFRALDGSDERLEYDWASLLRMAAADVEGRPSGELGAWISLALPRGRVEVPVDLALLGASKVAIRRHASQWAYSHARADGRLATAILERGTHVDDDGLDALALLCAESPARLLEADPRWFLSWRQMHRGLTSFPANLEDLAELLSEPSVEAEPPHLLRRLEEPPTPVWGDPMARYMVLLDAARVPLHSWVLLKTWLVGRTGEEDRQYWLQESVARLADPAEALTAELASSIHLCRLEAAMGAVHPTTGVPLQDELPTMLADVVAAVTRPPEKGTLAWAEVALYRECFAVVEVFRAASRLATLPMSRRLMLTMRLAGWVTDRLRDARPDARADALEALVRRNGRYQPLVEPDALDPRAWRTAGEEGGVEVRTAAVVHALATSTEGLELLRAGGLESVPEEVPSVTSPGLEARLAGLASRLPTPYEHRLRQLGYKASALEVVQPVAVPDVAISALLDLAGTNGLSLLEPEIRARFVVGLANEDSPLPRSVAERLAGALREADAGLSKPEVVELRRALASLRAREASSTAPLAVDLGLIVASVDETIPEWIGPALGSELAAESVSLSTAHRLGHYYELVARHHPDKLHETVAAMTARAQDPLDAVLAIGRVAIRGSDDEKDAAAAILRDLAGQEPYAGNPVYAQVMLLFGIEAPQEGE